jgi:hypothetical protein
MTNKPKAWIGIDPGLDGAIACLTESGEWELFVCPTQKIIVNKKNKRILDESEFFDIIWGLKMRYDVTFGIEKSSAMPRFKKNKKGEKEAQPMGVTSAHSTGTGWGLQRGIMTGLRIKYQIVNPKTWQKGLISGHGGKPKEKVLKAIQKLFPDQDLRKSPRCKKPHDGIVDAMGICLYVKEESENADKEEKI